MQPVKEESEEDIEVDGVEEAARRGSLESPARLAHARGVSRVIVSQRASGRLTKLSRC